MIWHLRLVDASRRYDLYTEFVVRAETADEARVVACSFVEAGQAEYRATCWNAGGPPTREEYARMANEVHAWRDETRSTVTVVPESGPSQVIANSFRHG